MRKSITEAFMLLIFSVFSAEQIEPDSLINLTLDAKEDPTKDKIYLEPELAMKVPKLKKLLYMVR